MEPFKGNLLGGPQPGQSLTREPGNAAFEKPPQFTDPEDALKFVLPRVMNPKNAARMLDLMENQRVPATTITDSLLLGGFAQGMWTPDVAALIGLPLYAAVIKSVELIDGKPLRGNEEEFKAKVEDRYGDVLQEEPVEDEGQSFMDLGEPPESKTPATPELEGMMPNEV